MKRTFSITAICILILATLGTTVVVTAKSQMYNFDVTYESAVIGKLTTTMTDPTAPTYSFDGRKLSPNVIYYLYCAQPSQKHYFMGSVIANKVGKVHMGGALSFPPTNLVDTKFELTTSPVHAVLMGTFDDWYQESDGSWTYRSNLDGSLSLGAITRYVTYGIEYDPDGNIVKEGVFQDLSVPPKWSDMVIRDGWYYTFTLTVYDGNGNSHTCEPMSISASYPHPQQLHTRSDS